MGSSKGLFVKNVLWESIGRFSSLIIQFLVTLLMARKLAPSDFGIIGLLNVFILVGRILLDSGFSQALIQKKDATSVDLSSVFYFNLFIGVVLYALLYVLSPYIALFYNEPLLTKYARILFLVIPINSLGLIQNVIIQKKLEFKKSTCATVLAAFISGLAGIIAMYNNWGIMALVLQLVLMHVLTTLLFILQERWYPLMRFSFASIKKLFSFSVNLLFTSLLTVLFNNVFTVIIGKFYSFREVGFYNQAKKFEDVSSSALTEVILKVSFPTLVNYKDDLALLKMVYMKIIVMTIFILSPMMCWLICVAKPLFIFLLTENWLPAVPYFTLLCLYGITFPLHQININVFKVLGDSRKILWIELFRRFVLIISIVITIQWSIKAMLIGQIVAMFIVIIVNMRSAGKLIGYSLFQQIIDVIPYYVIAFFSAVLACFVIKDGYSDVVVFFGRSMCFVCVYIIVNVILKLPAYKELKSLFNIFLNRIRN